jgi:hypothetical protein
MKENPAQYSSLGNSAEQQAKKSMLNSNSEAFFDNVSQGF